MYQPPTVLTQLYFTCVMSARAAWFNALGIAQANGVVYTTAFFSFLMIFLVNYLNRIKKVKPPIRTIAQIAADEAKEKAKFEEELRQTVREFNALRNDMANGTIGFKYNVTNAADRLEEDNASRESYRIANKEIDQENPMQHRV